MWINNIWDIIVHKKYILLWCHFIVLPIAFQGKQKNLKAVSQSLSFILIIQCFNSFFFDQMHCNRYIHVQTCHYKYRCFFISYKIKVTFFVRFAGEKIWKIQNLQTIQISHFFLLHWWPRHSTVLWPVQYFDLCFYWKSFIITGIITVPKLLKISEIYIYKKINIRHLFILGIEL